MKKLIILLALLNIAVLAQRQSATQRRSVEQLEELGEVELLAPPIQHEAEQRQAREADEQQAREAAERQARKAAEPRNGKFTDSRDGKTYKFVTIGEQTWMAQNLDYNGEDGFLGLCYGDEPKKKIKKPENCKKYGRLYNWEEAMSACPSGWHLPSDKEWQTLVDFAGGDKVAGKQLKDKNGWKAYDFSKKSPKSPKCKWTEEEIDNRGRAEIKVHDFCNTDKYGFSALPGSFVGENGDLGVAVSENGFWWSAREDVGGAAVYRYMDYHSGNVGVNGHIKSLLHSVRCVKEAAWKVAEAEAARAEEAKKAEEEEAARIAAELEAARKAAEKEAKRKANEVIAKKGLTDSRDGKRYKLTLIGDQLWMAQNLDYNAEGSKCYGDKPENCVKYGRLYNWETAMKVCPSGWHLPSREKWQILVDKNNNSLGKKFDAEGTDDYGFSGLRGGYRYPNGGNFSDVGNNGRWWSATELNVTSAYYQYMYHNGSDKYGGHGGKSYLYSIRCVKE